MFIVGLIVIALSGWCAFSVRSQRKRLREMVTTETMTTGELLVLQEAAAQAAGVGVFRQPCGLEAWLLLGHQGQ